MSYSSAWNLWCSPSAKGNSESKRQDALRRYLGILAPGENCEPTSFMMLLIFSSMMGRRMALRRSCLCWRRSSPREAWRARKRQVCLEKCSIANTKTIIFAIRYHQVEAGQGRLLLNTIIMLAVPNKNLEKLKGVIEAVTARIGAENLALVLMAVANLLWPISFVYVSQHHFNPIQTNLARGAAICLSHIVLCRALGIPLDFKSWEDMKYLLVRNTLIGVHQVIYTGMHFVLSFPLINSIVITGPLFVFIIDYYLNGVTITRTQAVGICIGFVGILVNINGDFLMTLIDPDYEITSSFEHYAVTDIRVKILFSLVAVLTNVVWGYAIVVQKKISHLPGIKISYFLGIEFVLSSGLALSFGGVEPIPTASFLTACLCSGLIMAMCQIMFISALNLSRNTGKLTMLMLLYGVSSYAISFFKYGERINLLCVLGLALMGYGLYRTLFGRHA